MKPLIEPDEVVEAEIEGLLFKVTSGKSMLKKTTWIAGMVTPDGRQIRCQVNYNPWTGTKLE